MVSTIETANAEIAVNSAKAPEGSVWRHKKSGGVYVVKLHVIVEATLAPAVVYHNRQKTKSEIWCRPASEFFDGRFERL